MKNWFLAVAIGFDVLVNAVIGGQAYQTVSCRIGENIQAHGWAYSFPWPAFLRKHFISSVYTTVV